jgi:hypothetical protein
MVDEADSTANDGTSQLRESLERSARLRGIDLATAPDRLPDGLTLRSGASIEIVPGKTTRDDLRAAHEEIEAIQEHLPAVEHAASKEQRRRQASREATPMRVLTAFGKNEAWLVPAYTLLADGREPSAVVNTIHTKLHASTIKVSRGKGKSQWKPSRQTLGRELRRWLVKPGFQTPQDLKERLKELDAAKG